MWVTECTHTSTADPGRVWAVLRDVRSWGEWNDGISTLSVGGDVALDARITMTTPVGQTLVSTIVELEEGRRLTDLTELDGVRVRVDHDVEATDDGARVTYRVAVDGDVPDEVAAEIGQGASADFPQVLAALIARAQGS